MQIVKGVKLHKMYKVHLRSLRESGELPRNRVGVNLLPRHNHMEPIVIDDFENKGRYSRLLYLL